MKNKHNRPENSFDTPLRVTSDDAGYIVYNKSYKVVCQNSFYVDAKRMARMPELYDALEQAVNEFCEGCLVKHGYLDEEHSYYDLISNGCVLNAKGCKAFPWLKLLQKVRDGE